MSQAILVVDDDDAIREGLAEALHASGRTVITCSDIESAQLVVENEELSAVVCDVRLSGPLSIDGINFIDHVRAQQSGSKIVVMSGVGVPEMAPEALRHGAAHFLAKPFDLIDLERALAPGDEEKAPSLSHVPSLSLILSSPSLSPCFQPIVETGSLAPVAYEGLIRLRGAAVLANPELLFEYARRKHDVPALEMACVERTLTAGTKLTTSNAMLFINTSPLSFSDPAFAARVIEVAERVGLPCRQIVIEITEQDAFAAGQPNGSIGDLAKHGVRFAFDDVGSAYSHLKYIDVIRPEFLKISQQFGTGFESDPTKEKIVRNIVALAAEFGCRTILEGVEDAPTLAAARELGIPLAQGYFFARPAPAEEFVARK